MRSETQCHAVDGASKACHGCGQVHGFVILAVYPVLYTKQITAVTAKVHSLPHFPKQSTHTHTQNDNVLKKEYEI